GAPAPTRDGRRAWATARGRSLPSWSAPARTIGARARLRRLDRRPLARVWRGRWRGSLPARAPRERQARGARADALPCLKPKRIRAARWFFDTVTVGFLPCERRARHFSLLSRSIGPSGDDMEVVGTTL